MTMEEAWTALGPDRYGIKLEARALAQAVLEEAKDLQLECDGCKPEDPCGYHYLRRRIEELGK